MTKLELLQSTRTELQQELKEAPAGAKRDYLLSELEEVERVIGYVSKNGIW